MDKNYKLTYKSNEKLDDEYHHELPHERNKFIKKTMNLVQSNIVLI